MKSCSFCGATEGDTRIIVSKKFNTTVCRKHFLQLLRHNSVFVTRYDKNTYDNCGDYCCINIFSKNGFIVGKALIDKEDVAKCSNYKWRLSHGYAVAHESGTNKSVFLHRLILEYSGSDCVDHINHNKLDNRKINLRVISHSANTANREIKYTGIMKTKSNRFQCTVWFNYKRYYLGTFDTREEALAAKLSKLKELHGFDVIV